MTRLGAKKKREKSIWTAKSIDLAEGEAVVFTGENGMMATSRGHSKITDEREYGEEEVKVACEWTLVFMLMFNSTESARWGVKCMEMAMSFPGGSYRYVFWWSARNLCRNYSWEEFRSYLAWKFSEYDSGRLRRDGPIW